MILNVLAIQKACRYVFIFFPPLTVDIFIVSKKVLLPFLKLDWQTRLYKVHALHGEKRPRVFRTQIALPPILFYPESPKKKSVIYIKGEGIRTTYDCISLSLYFRKL